jgi:hypothetical protein
MAFTNLIPDVTPSGGSLPMGSGMRYFYFSFVSPVNYVDFYLSRNRYSNEEHITRLYTQSSATSLLTSTYVRNVVSPTTFTNNFIGLSTPNGSTYINNTTTPNCRIVNLVPGTTYYLESRTIYNDVGTDFGLSVRTTTTVPLTYMRTETTSIPLPPTPPPPPPPIDGVSAIPTNLKGQSGSYGVELTWNESIGAIVYIVYRFGICVGKTANLRFVDSYVLSGGLYSYTISAANMNGESQQTNPVSIKPIFLFTDLVPDKTPQGVSLVDIGTRYYYFLFTPMAMTQDAYLHFNGIPNKSAIVGIYSTTQPSINLISNLTNIDSNLVYGNFTLGTLPDPQTSVFGIRLTAMGPYTNTTTNPNFTIKNLSTLTTYILEVVCVANTAGGAYTDLALYLKQPPNTGWYSGYVTPLLFNTTSLSQRLPSPYVMEYQFSQNSQSNFSTFIQPNMLAFQNAKYVVENMITNSPGARATGRSNDMVVDFTVEQMQAGVLGQSAIKGWKDDRNRSPDFPYEQAITFNTDYFRSGYFSNTANFNGSQTLNGVTNTAFFNTLLHEIFHGIGMSYIDGQNTTNFNFGWNQFLQSVSSGDPWYKGPVTGKSAAIESYKLNCRNSNLHVIPIEKDYGSGTANTHWDEGDTPSSSNERRNFSTLYHPALRLELMTGFLNRDDYLTGLTAGAFKDYGYNVNMNSAYIAAYPYTLIPSAMQPLYIENNHRCVCKNGMFSIVENGYSTILNSMLCHSTPAVCHSTPAVCHSTNMALEPANIIGNRHHINVILHL